ncbi:hypothetical protein D3C87_1927530 [compost metagenome]
MRTKRGHRKSPQAATKSKIASVASDGVTKGSRTREKTCQALAPSMIAASSSSRGMAAKALRIRKMPKALTAVGRMTPA